MKLGRIVYICVWQLTKMMLFFCYQFCTKTISAYMGLFFLSYWDTLSTAQPLSNNNALNKLENTHTISMATIFCVVI